LRNLVRLHLACGRESKILHHLGDQLGRLKPQHGLSAVVVGKNVEASVPQNSTVYGRDFFVHSRAAGNMNAAQFKVPNSFDVP
jgi:hypothetical protein